MRPGPPRGATDTLEVTVDAAMTARVDGRELHPVYGTVPLVADIERLCRRILEPHLEDGEEAVGGRLELLHRAPVPVGETVRIDATVASVGPSGLTCEFTARHAGAIVARGSFEQRLVQTAEFTALVDSRRTVVDS
ncbi:MAG: hypothetical protein JJT89_08430 [Nitriliruptoraceae bacterium]|nr:hypothetical protein [Nitriliruptoraceae bacterium]